MEFYISKNILGTPKSLVCSDDGTYKWSENPDVDVAVGDLNALINVNEIAKLLCLSVENLELSSKSQRNAFSELGVNETQIAWAHALSPEEFYRRLHNISEEVKKVICAYGSTNYGQTYKECKEFLRSLSRASVNTTKIYKYIEACNSGPSVISSLKSFLPPQGEQTARKAVYTQVGTSTFTVAAGPPTSFTTRCARCWAST